MVADRILLKPHNPANQTSGGLYLPPSVKEKEAIQTGVVMRVGPGYPLPPESADIDSFLGDGESRPRYMPLQVQEGDQAVFLQKHGFEIEIHGEDYMIVPQSAILLVFRDALDLDI